VPGQVGGGNVRDCRSWWQQFRRVAGWPALPCPPKSHTLLLCHLPLFQPFFSFPTSLLQPATYLRLALRHRTGVFWPSITGQNSTRLQHRVTRNTTTILASTSHLPHQHYPGVLLLLSSSSALRISATLLNQGRLASRARDWLHHIRQPGIMSGGLP